MHLLPVVDRNDPQLEPVCQPESVILEPASLQISSLEAHWNYIGVHSNATPKASLKNRFVSALKKDPFISDLCAKTPLPVL